MPELPEVETVKNDLKNSLIGKKIKSVDIKIEKLINTSIAVFKKKVEGHKIIDVDRRAKMIIVKLDNDYNLLVHLKMTGQLVLKSKKKVIGGGHPIVNVDKLPNKFSHIIFTLTSGEILFFNDVRKFGWVRLYDQQSLDKEFLKFGIEPLEKKFTLDKFKQILQKYPNRKIKQLLLDQKLIVGIGNIYADESCFASKILPTRIVKTLNIDEIKLLFLSIKKILKLAIKNRGTSISDYTDAFGQSGNFTSLLKVYGRGGEKCRECGGIIEKNKINGRGTHFCQKCQK